MSQREKNRNKNKEIPSPCVGVCQLDDDESYCIGCYRTVAEISHWCEYDNEVKKKIVDELDKRRRHYTHHTPRN